MGNFSADLKKFTERKKLDLDKAVREVVTELHAEVDRRSPVGNPDIWKPPGGPPGYVGGHFRANNQYKFGSVPTGEIDGVDPTGSNAVSVAKAGIYSAPAAGVHYIANNVTYSIPIEEGHSTQAPQGVYKLAMMTIVGKLQNIIK